jgi:hypothetical protein
MMRTDVDFNVRIGAILGTIAIDDTEFAVVMETVAALVRKGYGVRTPEERRSA